MLVLFYGPSGVGKTTLIRLLERHHGWRCVRTVSTRPARAHEERMLLPREEFERRMRGGEIAHVNEFYGDLYGSVAADFDLAISTGVNARFAVDMSIQQPLSRQRYPHLALAVVPADASQISRQLVSAGRPDREAAALAEYSQCYGSLEDIIGRVGEPCLLVVNDGTPEALASRIDVMARAWPRTGGHTDRRESAS